jgi:endogenous inhibitor of DNA gyrase (YacG/DUF329 family)
MKNEIKCPQCGNPSSFSSENDWRPFCSERCSLIDLGDWMDENHRIITDDSLNKTSTPEEPLTKH